MTRVSVLAFIAALLGLSAAPQSARAASEDVEVYADSVTSVQAGYWGYKLLISVSSKAGPVAVCPQGSGVTDNSYIVAVDSSDQEIARKTSIATAALLAGKRIRMTIRCDPSLSYDHRPVLLGIGILQ